MDMEDKEEVKIDPLSHREVYKDKIKVMVSEPTLGWIHHQVYDNRKDFVMELARYESKSNYKFFTMNTGRLLISYARELICDQALLTGMDYVLFIDDDMIVPPDLFQHLAQIDADIVAPLCTTRNFPFEPVVYRSEISDKEVDGSFKLRNTSVTDIERNAIIDAETIGFGVVLIKVDILKKIPKPWFFVNQAVGEDILFCIRARQHVPGFKVKVNTGVIVGHMGDPEIRTIKDFDRIKGTKEYDDFIKKYRSQIEPKVNA